jgi:V-type H+-transporting ATPase subunit a
MNIFLKFGKLPEFNKITWPILEPEECRKYLGLAEDEIYVDEEKQGSYDWILLADRNTLYKLHLAIAIIFIILIVVMLVPKIAVENCQNKRKLNMNNIQPQNIIENQNEENQVFQEEFVQPREQRDEPPKGLSDLIVEGAIETIEFVLGTVSNTASYLRLWALSLAHSQLAKVFFSKTIILIGNATSKFYINFALLIVAFPVFSGFTALVLLFMDLMECFLHTLRLHWVEFQNKFYKADGYQFKPFCFSKNIELKEDEFDKT